VKPISGYELQIYRTVTGKCPFRDWQDLLAKKAQAVIDGRIARVQAGNLGDCKIVASGVMELRVDFGPGYRVYFTISGNQIVILLLGGNKTTQKKDIKKASQYFEDWRDR
jgi:putative addiction module killer protein